MKHIIVVLAVLSLVCLSSSVIADDEPKYQVDITIRYNAVSPEEAAKIARQIMVEHSKACETKVEIKKVGGDEVYVYDESITFTPYGYTTD